MAGGSLNSFKFQMVTFVSSLVLFYFISLHFCLLEIISTSSFLWWRCICSRKSISTLWLAKVKHPKRGFDCRTQIEAWTAKAKASYSLTSVCKRVKQIHLLRDVIDVVSTILIILST
ncbi:unnamed protein product [Amoebophrya sp. A25]|nr:unnamed protein product [Amoebophrya sp. A25]|eukprot:GSA25T00024776001.1